MSIKEKLKLKDRIDFKEIINYQWVKKSKDTIQKKAFKAMIAFLFLMILFTMLSRFADSLTVPIVKVSGPKSKTMVDELKALGKVSKNRENKVAIEAGLTVDYVNVSIGSVIKKDDVIAELNVEKLQDKVDEINELIKNDQKILSRAIEDYNKAISEKNSNLTKAQNEMNTAKKALDEYKAKEDKDPIQEDDLAAEYQMKKSAYDMALSDSKDTVALDRMLQDAKDSSKVDEYNAELAKVQPYLDTKGKILAKVEGVVTSVFVENGGVTSEAIISLADKDAGYKFIGQIEKSNKAVLKQGQKVVLSLNNGYEVIDNLTIEALASSRENPAMIDITVMMPAGVGDIEDSGEIIISSKSKKYNTCVPLSAIRQGDDGNYYVLIVTEQDTVLGKEKIAKKVDIRIEKKDGELAALAEGSLSRTEQIIVSSNKNIEDGDRVRLETE